MDFFPLSEKKSKNFPNTKKNILAELHFKKIKKKIRETFLFTQELLGTQGFQHRTCKTSLGGIPA